MPCAASQILAVEVHDAKGGVSFDQSEGTMKKNWYDAFPNMKAMDQFSRFEHHRSLRL